MPWIVSTILISALILLVWLREQLRSPKDKSTDRAILKEILRIYNKIKDLDGLRKEFKKNSQLSKLLTYRRGLYQSYRQKGVSVDSPDSQRIHVFHELIQWIHANITPPDDYTLRTDRHHIPEVAALSRKYYAEKNNGEEAPAVLVVAALLHDMERFLPIKVASLPSKYDPYRKRVLHGLQSAQVSRILLEGAPLSESEKDDIFEIIRHHDSRFGEEITILGEPVIWKIRPGLEELLQTLMDADSYSFFMSTISIFIEDRIAKGKSSKWLKERIVNNLRRLRPQLRRNAFESLGEMSRVCREAISWDDEITLEDYVAE